MKKYTIKALLILSILFLFVSMLILTGIFLWDNRSVILKNFGISLRDDCSVSGSSLSCGFVYISSDRFNIKLKNLNTHFDFMNFIKKDEPFLNVKIGYGDINLKIKKSKKTAKTKNPLQQIYFLIYFVKTDIDRIYMHITLPDKKTLIIKDFSFFSDLSFFNTKKPFYFQYDGIEGKVLELSGDIQPSHLTVKSLRSIINKGLLVLNGDLDYQGNFSFSGIYSGKEFYFRNLYAKDLQVSFNINRIEGLSSGNLDIRSKIAELQNASLENLSGKIHFQGKDKISGNAALFSDKFISGKLSMNSLKLEGKFTADTKKKSVKVEGDAKSQESIFQNILIPDLSSSFRLVFDKNIQAEGVLSSGSTKVNFSYSQKKLTLTPDYLDLGNIKRFVTTKTDILQNIKGTVSGKVVIDLKSKKTSADLNVKNLYLYGLVFPEGDISSEINNRDITGIYTINLKTKNGFCFLSGSFDRKFITADLTFDNVDISSLKYGKKFGFGGIVDGAGKVQGQISDIYVHLEGSAHRFFYKSIFLKNIFYSLEYSSKKLKLNIKNSENNINGRMIISFKPVVADLKLSFKNSDLSFSKDYLRSILPDIFNYITPKEATGKLNVLITQKKWSVFTDFRNTKIVIDPAGDFVFADLKGYFSPDEKSLDLKIKKRDFNLRGYIVRELSGKLLLKDGKILSSFKSSGLKDFKDMNLSAKLQYDLNSKSVEVKVNFEVEKEKYKNHLSGEFKGNLKNIKGFLKERAFFKGKDLAKTDVHFRVKIGEKKTDLMIKTKSVELFLPQKFQIHFLGLKGDLSIPENRLEKMTGSFEISNFTASQNFLYFFDSSKISLNVKNGVIDASPISFTGIINGKIENFRLDIPRTNLSFFSEGTIDKNLLSVIIRFVNISGDLRYTAYYEGNIQKFWENLHLEVSSQNAGLKTAFTVGILDIKRALLSVENGDINIDVTGRSPDIILGESKIIISGKGSAVKKFINLSASTRFFPIKYQNIFQGNVNSDIKLKTFIKNSSMGAKIKGKLLLSGRVRFEEDLEKLMVKRNQKKSVNLKNENLEKVFLDLDLESYVPIYLYGRWGKAYAEFNLNVKGKASDPVINGNLSIIYGEIRFMKNRYNIDFANIKIVDNEPYISARISTSIADTFIFIDLSGSALNPRINFSSSPPKSKDEILSILLLRDTPTALENMPVFKTVGKVLYSILPFKPSEETGFFNTGFEVNILPEYSPTTGISASVYAKRSITRRIFVALSKPLGQVEEEKVGGWYGFGIRLKERTSFQYKFFETGNQEFGIVFNLPFDF